MNELLLYEIIKAVLGKSLVIQGRFHVLEGYGNDLNANALDNFVNEMTVKRFPISVLMPPVEIVDKYEAGWARFKLEQYFLAKHGAMKTPNTATNSSRHPVTYDWKDMRECAGDFRVMFNKVLRSNKYLGSINSATDSKDYFQRVTKVGNDALNGIRLTYELNIAQPCTLADYPDQNIVLPDLDTIIHPIHIH